MPLSNSRRTLSKITGEIVAWLDPAQADQARQQVAIWGETDWQFARQATMIQGIGPYFHTTLPGTAIYAALPVSFCEWLAGQHERNADRLRVLHGDLQGILRQATRVGVRIMPLKGSLLTTRYYPSPALRPMADIDLLIAPQDLAAMQAIMQGLGYRYVKLPDEYKNEYRFIHPTARRVVDPHSEHRDNPRPVEVHTGLRSGVWGGAGTYDVTAQVWSAAQAVTILGEPAWTPAPEHLLTSLVTHTFRHFFRNEGRAIQWLDLAYVTPSVGHIPTDLANWSYPVYRMAQRALPGRFAEFDLTTLARAAHPRIRRWSESVPLDAACGLTVATVAPEYRNLSLAGRLGTAWAQWRPNPWRLALAFGDTPIALAYGRYAIFLLSSLWARLQTRLVS